MYQLGSAVCITSSGTAMHTANHMYSIVHYPRRSRSAIGVDIVLTLDVCMFVCMLAL